MTFPRVTHILQAVGLGPDLSCVPADLLSAALERGSAVHALIEADAYGYLDPDEVDPAHAGYLDAYRKFVAESGHEPIASELLVEHPIWGYRGHIDRVGWMIGKRAILDWKSGWSADLRAARPQLAGYRLAYNAARPSEPVEVVAAVNLRADGTYRFHEVGDLAGAEQTFLAAVVVYRALEQAGRVKEPA